MNPAERLTDAQIQHRLDVLERIIARANWKDLPALNKTFQALLDEQVRRNMIIIYGDVKALAEGEEI